MSKPRKLNTGKSHTAKELLRYTVIIPAQKANREKVLQNILNYNILK